MPGLRTLARMAERSDVQPALKKLWKKHYKVDGQITQHLSPFEQRIFTPMLDSAGEKTYKYVKGRFWEMWPGVLFLGGVYYGAEAEFANDAFHHRP